MRPDLRKQTQEVKMKSLKIILALILVLTLFASLGVQAFAADEDAGSPEEASIKLTPGLMDTFRGMISSVVEFYHDWIHAIGRAFISAIDIMFA